MEHKSQLLVVDDDPVVGRSFDRVLAGKGRKARTVALDDAALDVLLGVGLRVALDEIHTLDNHAVLRGDDPQHTPALSRGNAK